MSTYAAPLDMSTASESSDTAIAPGASTPDASCAAVIVVSDEFVYRVARIRPSLTAAPPR